MKKILFALFVVACLAPRPAHAVAVSISLSTTTKCVPVSVSNSAATAMLSVIDSTTSAPGLPTIISIQNQNATATNAIFCSNDVAVSSVSAPTASSHLGWAIPGANGSMDFTLLGTQQFYCFGGLVSAAIQAEVCKIH